VVPIVVMGGQQRIGELVKLRRFIAVGLLGAGMTLLPFATGVATAANNGNGNNGDCTGGNGNGNGGNSCNSNGQGAECTPRGSKGHYPQSPNCRLATNKSSANPGDNVNFTTNAFNGSMTLHSTPVFLGSFTNADALGNQAGTVTIPCNTPAGVHTLEYDGAMSDGTPIALTATLNVTNKPCVLGETVTNTQTPAAASTPAAAGTTNSASTLPFTGAAATTMLVTLSLGLIAAGAVALAAAKRRRTT